MSLSYRTITFDGQTRLSGGTMIDAQAFKRKGLPAIVFDGDDTLWQTDLLYDNARKEVAGFLLDVGIGREEFELEQRAIDIDLAKQLGVNRVRFPRSNVDAARILADRHSISINRRQLHRVGLIASEVFKATAPINEGAASVIENLRNHFQIALLTKGDDGIQKKRLADSKLARLLDFASIVEKKDEDSFRYVLSRLQANPTDSWSVGNSFESDVLPSLAIGLRAIRLDVNAWPHEDAVDMSEYVGKYFTVGDLTEIPSLIADVVGADEGSS